MSEENKYPESQPETAPMQQQGAAGGQSATPPPPPVPPPPPDAQLNAVVSSPQEGALPPPETAVMPAAPETAPLNPVAKFTDGIFGKAYSFLKAKSRDFQLTPQRAAVVIAVVLAGSIWNHIMIKRWLEREHTRARTQVQNSIQKNFIFGRDAGRQDGVRQSQDFVSGFKLKIIGKPDFEDQVMKALGLIWNGDNAAFRQIKKYVYVIRRAEKTDFAIENDAPTILLTDNTAFRSATWCAGAIGRQFFHTRRYVERERLKHELAVPSTPGKAYLDSIASNPILSDYHDAQSIERMEREADDFQLKLMRAVGAPSAELLLIEDRQPFDYSLVNDGK
jgi:hypothetical protein